MKNISAFLTVLLFVFIGLSFFVRSTWVYVAAGAVFILDIVLSSLVKGNTDNNSNENDNNKEE